MNAGANAWGNQVPPIIVAVDPALSVAVNPEGNCVKMVCIGLYPKKAAKTAEAGGTCANTASLSCGAPAPAAADANDAGNVEESTKNIILNMIATPIVLPTFLDRASHSGGGTSLIWRDRVHHRGRVRGREQS